MIKSVYRIPEKTNGHVCARLYLFVQETEAQDPGKKNKNQLRVSRVRSIVQSRLGVGFLGQDALVFLVGLQDLGKILEKLLAQAHFFHQALFGVINVPIGRTLNSESAVNGCRVFGHRYFNPLDLRVALGEPIEGRLHGTARAAVISIKAHSGKLSLVYHVALVVLEVCYTMNGGVSR